jgi:hypothetical protein
LAVSVHVDRETGDGALYQPLAHFKVVLFELTCAVADDQNWDRGVSRGQKKSTNDLVAQRLKPN